MNVFNQPVNCLVDVAMPHGHLVDNEEGGFLEKFADSAGIGEGAVRLSSHIDRDLGEIGWKG